MTSGLFEKFHFWRVSHRCLSVRGTYFTQLIIYRLHVRGTAINCPRVESPDSLRRVDIYLLSGKGSDSKTPLSKKLLNITNAPCVGVVTNAPTTPRSLALVCIVHTYLPTYLIPLKSGSLVNAHNGYPASTTYSRQWAIATDLIECFRILKPMNRR